jgi:VWFA-related protein
LGWQGRTLSAAILSASLTAAQTTPTFRADVSLVHVDAEVVEEGRILTGFTKDDFRVLDEGKPQPIMQFSSGELPLDLILLFDVSGSMQWVVSQVAAASRQAFQELRQGDRVCVRVFNRKSREIAGFTDDLEAVRKTIQDDVLSLHFGGGTLIQAAVQEAALRFRTERKTEGRRAVLIITDNLGIRTRSESAVVRDFWEADALLSGLIVSNSAATARRTASIVLAPYMIPMIAGMKGIAEKTGGDAISSGDAGPAFQEAMRRIRNRYSLYYAQPEAKPGAPRTIHVELAGDAAKQHPRARVRARTGYIVPKN